MSDFNSSSSSHNASSVTTDEPIGGWLLLLGMGIAFTPIFIALNVLRSQIPWFVDGDWQLITSPESEEYNPQMALTVIFELVCNIGLLIGYTRLAILFYRKSKNVPRLYVVLSTLYLCIILIDTYLLWLAQPDLPLVDFDSLKKLVFTIASTTIWGAYMLTSERVKRTFV